MISNSEFYQQGILHESVPLLCAEDIVVEKSIEFANGPQINFCQGVFNNLEVMVKYTNSKENGRVLRDELVAIR